jgi:hypothetical protein
VRNVAAVGTSGLGGAVGVEDELPASSMNADIMMELTHQGTILHGRFAAVFLVAEVVHVAVNRRAPAFGPGALAVPEEDGAADVGRDAVAVANVQGQARGVVWLSQEVLAEDRGDACRAGYQVDGQAGHPVAQGPPRPR